MGLDICLDVLRRRGLKGFKDLEEAVMLHHGGSQQDAFVDELCGMSAENGVKGETRSWICQSA